MGNGPTFIDDDLRTTWDVDPETLSRLRDGKIRDGEKIALTFRWANFGEEVPQNKTVQMEARRVLEMLKRREKRQEIFTDAFIEYVAIRLGLPREASPDS